MTKKLNRENFVFTRSVQLENMEHRTFNRVDVGRFEGVGGKFSVNGRVYSATVYVQLYKIADNNWEVTVSTYNYRELTDSARAALKELAQDVAEEFFTFPTEEEIAECYRGEGRSIANGVIWELEKRFNQTIGYQDFSPAQLEAFTAAREELAKYLEAWKPGTHPRYPNN